MMHQGLLWILFEKFGASFLSVAVFFVYAKLLSPHDMGVAIIILSVTQFIALLINTYFEDGLVQKKEFTTIDKSTTFWVSSILSMIAMVLVCAGFWIFEKKISDAPLLAMAAFASLEILFTNLATCYVAALRRDGHFKLLALRVVAGRVGGAIVGLIVVMAGGGAWSILAQSVVGMLLQLLIIMIPARSIPPFAIARYSLKERAHFGLMLTLRRLSWDSFVRMTPIIAGMIGGTSAAGIVGFAWRIVELLRSSLSSGLSGYLLPLFSRHQGHKENLRKDFITTTGINAFFVTPVFLGLFLTAPALIDSVFDDKWHETSLLIQYFSLAALISCYRVPATIVMTAANQPGKMLLTDSIASLLCMGIMIVYAGNTGLWVIAAAHIIFNIIILPKSFTIINAITAVPAFAQTQPIIKYSTIGWVMFCVVLLVSFFLPALPSWQNLILNIGLGGVIFMGLSFLFHRNDITTWLSHIKGQNK